MYAEVLDFGDETLHAVRQHGGNMEEIVFFVCSQAQKISSRSEETTPTVFSSFPCLTLSIIFPIYATRTTILTRRKQKYTCIISWVSTFSSDSLNQVILSGADSVKRVYLYFISWKKITQKSYFL
jgi:hypothetical protein